MKSEIYVFAKDLLIPILMIILGKYFSKHAPKNINAFYGYRTSMSMKNKETWEFSHHYCGKLWFNTGWVSLIISVLLIFFVIGKDENTIKTFRLILYAIQITFLTSPILFTEIALKKNFDKNGNKAINSKG